MRKYSLTKEHKAQLGPWAEKWIRNAMSTEAMTYKDRDLCRDAIVRMYRAAKLEPPKRIVFVESPFVLAFAGGAAAWRCLPEKNGLGATYGATYAATIDCTNDATYDATIDATRDSTSYATYDDAIIGSTRGAIRDATYGAIRDATYAATIDATHDAVYAATSYATYDATYDATIDSTRDATSAAWYKVYIPPITKEQRECVLNVHNMWQGGNQWSAYDSFISFFRHVVKLPIDYTAWDPWETLSLHSGPRIVHADFCMISDRPKTLTVDDQHRPHNEHGPFCEWLDGSALYAWHGTRVPPWIIEKPEEITEQTIMAEQNSEVRRVMIERYGIDRLMCSPHVEKLHQRGDYELLAFPDPAEGKIVALKMRCPTTSAVFIHTVPPGTVTVEQALNWKFQTDDYFGNLIKEA